MGINLWKIDRSYRLTDLDYFQFFSKICQNTIMWIIHSVDDCTAEASNIQNLPMKPGFVGA